MININNLTYWLDQQAKLINEQNFLCTNSKNYSFGETRKYSYSVLNYFQKKNLATGTHIALLSKSNENLIFIVLGLWYAGLVPVIINKDQTPNEIEYQIQVSNSKLQFDTDKFKFSKSEKAVTQKKYSSKRKALIIFTSGSTGQSKAVVHNFSSLYQSVLNSDSFIKYSANDSWLASLPFYHIGGFAIVLRSLIAGLRCCLPGKLGNENFHTTITKFNPSYISLVPTLFDKLLNDGLSRWTNLKAVFLGGGPVAPSKAKYYISQNWPINIVYGSSETAAMITGYKVNDSNNFSVGKALGDVQLKIINKNILIKTKSLFIGFQKQSKLEKPELIDGFFKSEDIGFIKNNFLYINSRRNNLIISGGKNIDPKEIENTIYKYLNVDQVVVFPVENDKWGQKCCAVIVKSNKRYSENFIQTELKKYLSNYKIPKNIVFLDKLPLTNVGKINFKKLKKHFKSEE